MPNLRFWKNNKQEDLANITQELYKKSLELYKQQSRVEKLLYRISEAIFAIDKESNLTLFNHTLEDLLSIRAKDVLGKNVNEFIKLETEDGKPYDATVFSKADSEYIDVPDVLVLKATDKNHYVHARVSVIESDLKEYLVTMTDITREKEFEKSKDEFISIVSHELRTPMTIIKSYLWMLNSGKGGELTEVQTKYITKAMTGSERMISLINDILNISRVEQGKIAFKPEEINLKNFIKEVTEEFKLKAEEKKLELSCTYPEEEITLYQDKQKIYEILLNLVGNSIKYTDEGSITIIAEKVDNERIRISIKDTGRGIGQDERDQLFKKFQRLSSTFTSAAEAEGTGLGLYIVNLYVSKMGGTVGVESEGTGKGSTFYIEIPFRQKS